MGHMDADGGSDTRIVDDLVDDWYNAANSSMSLHQSAERHSREADKEDWRQLQVQLAPGTCVIKDVLTT